MSLETWPEFVREHLGALREKRRPLRAAALPRRMTEPTSSITIWY